MRAPLLTERLLIRDVTEADAELIFHLDSDPNVMRYIGPLLADDASWYRDRIRTAFIPKQTHPKAFFAQAINLHDEALETIATDGLASYRRAISEELSKDTEHEVRPCTPNLVEQSHRRIRHRYYPTLGFGELDAAQRFRRAVDEVGDFLRPRSRMAEFVFL